jgi:drug/metabolite transporter (DMT)-like permease
VIGNPVNGQRRGAVLGLTSAALFGLSAPLAKLLLGGMSPVLLAGLLYLGAAAGLWIYRVVQHSTNESALRRSDVPTLMGVVFAGGVLGPVLMLIGLNRVSAFTGSLLLNLEGVFTVGLAVVVFGEHFSRYATGAAILVFVGALILKIEPGAVGADSVGVVALAGACLCWALDNNLTQRLSLRDPFAIVRIKTLCAGVVNTTLGIFAAGIQWPQNRYIVAALGLGSVSYGISVVLDTYALRFVGAAREAAYLATGPFVGAAVARVIWSTPVRWYEVLAMTSMAAGIVLLLRERHSHRHTHEAMTHEHVHWHDEHHGHPHEPGMPAGEPHSHAHQHSEVIHEHPHMPDAHHRHRH